MKMVKAALILLALLCQAANVWAMHDVAGEEDHSSRPAPPRGDKPDTPEPTHPKATPLYTPFNVSISTHYKYFQLLVGPTFNEDEVVDVTVPGRRTSDMIAIPSYYATESMNRFAVSFDSVEEDHLRFVMGVLPCSLDQEAPPTVKLNILMIKVGMLEMDSLKFHAMKFGSEESDLRHIKWCGADVKRSESVSTYAAIQKASHTISSHFPFMLIEQLPESVFKLNINQKTEGGDIREVGVLQIYQTKAPLFDEISGASFAYRSGHLGQDYVSEYTVSTENASNQTFTFQLKQQKFSAEKPPFVLISAITDVKKYTGNGPPGVVQANIESADESKLIINTIYPACGNENNRPADREGVWHMLVMGRSMHRNPKVMMDFQEGNTKHNCDGDVDPEGETVEPTRPVEVEPVEEGKGEGEETVTESTAPDFGYVPQIEYPVRTDTTKPKCNKGHSGDGDCGDCCGELYVNVDVDVHH